MKARALHVRHLAGGTRLHDLYLGGVRLNRTAVHDPKKSLRLVAAAVSRGMSVTIHRSP